MDYIKHVVIGNSLPSYQVRYYVTSIIKVKSIIKDWSVYSYNIKLDIMIRLLSKCNCLMSYFMCFIYYFSARRQCRDCSKKNLSGLQ